MNATSLAKIPILLWRVAWRIGPSQIGLIAAGVAFYSLLAVFPAIAAIVALAGLFTEPEAIVTQLETVSRVMPEDAARILIDQAQKVSGAGTEGLSLALVLGVLFAIYLSTRATTGVIQGLNAAHGRTESRGIVKYWATVVGLTVALLFGIALLFVLLVIMPTLLAFLPEELLSVELSDALRSWRWVVMALVVFFGFAVLFRFGPCRRKPRWRWFTPGLVLAVCLWFAGSFGFSVYVSNFGQYNKSFGGLGGVIILLTWLWLSAYVVFLGALIDSEYERIVGGNMSLPS